MSDGDLGGSIVSAEGKKRSGSWPSFQAMLVPPQPSTTIRFEIEERDKKGRNLNFLTKDPIERCHAVFHAAAA